LGKTLGFCQFSAHQLESTTNKVLIYPANVRVEEFENQIIHKREDSLALWTKDQVFAPPKLIEFRLDGGNYVHSCWMG
jgi:hypothetical protein